MRSDKIDISIWMITYNHVQYITEAIESVLAQKCAQSIEIVIADDCSTDGTRDILKTYKESYPDLIHVVYNEANLGPTRNAYDSALTECRGEFLAALEGDDYWIDEKKLQLQYEYLRSRPLLSACFTKHYCLKDGEIYPDDTACSKSELASIDLLKGSTPHTSTLMIRKAMMPNPIPEQFYRAENNDTFLLYLLAKKGPIGYIDMHTAIYRITDTGLYMGKDMLKRYVMREKTYRMMLQIADTKTDRKIIVGKIGGCIGKQIEHGTSPSEIVKRIFKIIFHDIRYFDKATARMLKNIMHYF